MKHTNIFVLYYQIHWQESEWPACNFEIDNVCIMQQISTNNSKFPLDIGVPFQKLLCLSRIFLTAKAML